MNETVTKRFLLYFRLMMVVWILIANAFFHAIEFEYSWLVFLSNIMLFTMEGDIKDRFISVELGGLVGMVLTVLAMLAIGALTPVLGGMLGLLLPLGRTQRGMELLKTLDTHHGCHSIVCSSGILQKACCFSHA